MSNENNDLKPLYNKKVSLVARAMEEFNKVSVRQETTGSKMNSSIKKEQAAPKKRSGLGRGLSSLMSSTTSPVVDVSLPGDKISSKKIEDIETKIDEKSNKERTDSLLMLGIDQLEPNPDQPRKDFSELEIKELAASIRRSGLIQPVLVRKKSFRNNSTNNKYQIIAGERRWRAAKEAGIESVPAILRELSDREAIELGIIENVQRQDLTPIEEALSYKKLTEEFGVKQEELSKIIGKDRTSISNTLRLLTLPAEIQKLLKERKLTQGHAKAILSLPSEEEQLSLAHVLIRDGLSVREAEKKVSSSRSKVDNTSIKNTDLSSSGYFNKDMEERLRRALGTKVHVRLKEDGKGEVKISFFSKAEFESFIEKIDA